MYNAFFQFEENPFSSRPDPAFFYRSKQHDMSLRSLAFAVQARMGLSSLAGEEGSGKTMLLESLRETLEAAQIQCVFLRDSRISANRFFQTIASELDLRCQGTSAYQVFSALHQFTLQQSRKGRTVALMVDDAHNLPADVLNEILHLASLHDEKVKLLQTVLAGRPELHSMLDTLNLERLKQHAILSCHLDPFTADDTERYIEFRLAKAGLAEQTIFPPDAISEIYLRSRGFAPAIHAVCEGLLLAAFAAGSKVCTPEILDQVFRNPRREESGIAVTGIDPAIAAAPSEPEPPALLTALMGLTFAAVKSLPPPLAVSANELLDPQRVALRLMFPTWNFELPVRGFAWGAKKPMHLAKSVRTAFSTASQTVPILSQPQVTRPVLSKPVVSAEPRSERKLQRIAPNRVAIMACPCAVFAKPIDFPSVALQPAYSIGSLTAAVELLALQGGNKLARLSYKLKPNSGSTGHAYAPAGALPVESLGPVHPVAMVPLAGRAAAPRVSARLLPLACSVTPAVTPDAASLPISLAPAPQIAHPAASLQPAGAIPWPQVAVTPFAIAGHTLSSRRDNAEFQAPLVNLQKPAGPRLEADLIISGEPNVPERNHLFSLPCNVEPIAPAAAERPISAFLTPLQSLRPLGPVSKLEALNPRNSWLLLPSWKAANTNPVARNPVVADAVLALEAAVAETRKPTFDQKWLLTLAIPILSVIALYGLLAGPVTQGWQRAHRAVLNRAAVAFREDFRTGLDDWMVRGGARPSWTSDAAGFVHPASLALYRPSLGMTDYQVQFVGTIDKKDLSWVVRAADFNNYYAVRLTVLKPGPVPVIGVARYAVVNGKTQKQVTTPLIMSARSDTVYRVSLDVRGDHFALSVQDQPVDSWSEPKLRQGGIGFFSEPDAGSRVAGLQIKGQDDILGELCAFLAPSDVASYRASLSERAALTLTSEMKLRSGGPYGRRLPGGTGRLDPAFWQTPEVDVPNARRCAPATSRLGGVRKHASHYTGAASTTCY